MTVTLDVNAELNAGQVIDAAIGAGANRVDGIVFFISPDTQQQIRDTLIRDAIANARQRANIAAEALAMTISGVQSATLNPIDFPVYSVNLREGAAAQGRRGDAAGRQRAARPRAAQLLPRRLAAVRDRGGRR